MPFKDLRMSIRNSHCSGIMWTPLAISEDSWGKEKVCRRKIEASDISNRSQFGSPWSLLRQYCGSTWLGVYELRPACFRRKSNCGFYSRIMIVLGGSAPLIGG